MTARHDYGSFERLSDILNGGVPVLSWLAEPVLTTDALCVIGAPPKSAKTWALTDLVVSIATGKSWLGTFKVGTPGPVVFVAPEGGRLGLARRAYTILESSGKTPSDVDLVFVRTRSVNLTDARDLADLTAAVKANGPRLLGFDSLYLGLGDVRTSQLAEVGRALRCLSDIATEHGCAVALTHHLAKTQLGSGIQSLSGSGVAEWASTILIGTPGPGGPTGVGITEMPVAFEVTGREIPGFSFTATFKIEGDPTDLSVLPRFSVDVRLGEAEALPHQELGWVEQRLLQALRGAGEAGCTERQVGDLFAAEGKPLRKPTIRDGLRRLLDLELIDGADDRWWVGTPAQGRLV